MNRHFTAITAVLLPILLLPKAEGQNTLAWPQPLLAICRTVFHPGQVPSLGTLTVEEGQTVLFDTGGLGRAPTLSGVLSGTGVPGRSRSDRVEVAVFAFDSISIAKGAVVEVAGDRGLVLVAKGEIAINGVVNLSGDDGAQDAATINQWNLAAKGGPGAEGGVEGATFASNPPPENRGDGSPGAKDSGFSGKGYGAGFNRRVKGGAGGGGAGHGGAGGASSISSTGGHNGSARKPMPGGLSYGSCELSDLFGGSGGAGGSNDRGYNNAGGGGGGGALALVSATDIRIGATGQILVRGGAGGAWDACGGGGSGGAILLAAPAVQLADTARVDAGGGPGGSAKGVQEALASQDGRLSQISGGGGGGGRIAVYSDADLGAPGKDQVEVPPRGFSVAGGAGGDAAEAGRPGTWYDGSLPTFLRSPAAGAPAAREQEARAEKEWTRLSGAAIPYPAAAAQVFLKDLQTFAAVYRTTAGRWRHDADLQRLTDMAMRAASSNLVGNPGFEEDTRDWSPADHLPFAGCVATTDAHGGKRVARLGQVQQRLELTSGDTYHLSLWWRGDADDVMAVSLDGKDVIAVHKQQTTTWQRLESDFLATTGQTVLKIATKGTVELDDVSVVRIAPARTPQVVQRPTRDAGGCGHVSHRDVLAGVLTHEGNGASQSRCIDRHGVRAVVRDVHHRVAASGGHPL